MAADLVNAGQQVIALDRMDHRKRRSARHWIPAERAAVVPFGEDVAERAKPDADPDRETTADSLRERDHIRLHTLGLVQEPRAGAADTRLDLIKHEDRTRRGADVARRTQIALRSGNHAALAQHRFEKYSRSAFGDRGRERLGVTVRHEHDIGAERTERLADRRFAGERERAHRATVEAALGRDDVAAIGAGVPPHQLVSGLVGLSAAIGEEHFGVSAEQADQLLGQSDRRLMTEEVAGVGNRHDLLRHGIDDGRVGVPESRHRNAGDQVEVRPPVGVPYRAALATYQRHCWCICRHHDRTETAEEIEVAHGKAFARTMVPIPSSVKISSRTACGTRPSRTCALATPPRTARRHASIFGTMPDESDGSRISSSSALSALMTSSLAGQSAYRPSTSVSTTSFSAPSATASAAAAVSALTL